MPAIEELNQRLSGLRERLAYKQKLEASIGATQRALAYHRARLPSLDSAMQKESHVVTKLEQMNARSIVAAVLGRKEQDLEKGRRELLAASLQHHQCQHAIATCDVALEDLEASLAALGDVEALYAAALAEKEKCLVGGLSARATHLMHLSEEMSVVRFDISQAVEACSAGESVLESLDTVSEALSAVVRDQWVSVGELITTAPMTTVALIGDVAEACEDAQDTLRAFQRELADVGIRTDLTLDLDELTEESRRFFGSLYTTAGVKSRVSSAHEEVEALREIVETLTEDVEARRVTLQTRLGGLESERVRSLEDA